MTLMDNTDYRTIEKQQREALVKWRESKFKVAEFAYTIGGGGTHNATVLYRGQPDNLENYLLSHLPENERPHFDLHTYNTVKCYIDLLHPSMMEPMYKFLKAKFEKPDKEKKGGIFS